MISNKIEINFDKREVLTEDEAFVMSDSMLCHGSPDEAIENHIQIDIHFKRQGSKEFLAGNGQEVRRYFTGSLYVTTEKDIEASMLINIENVFKAYVMLSGSKALDNPKDIEKAIKKHCGIVCTVDLAEVSSYCKGVVKASFGDVEAISATEFNRYMAAEEATKNI